MSRFPPIDAATELWSWGCAGFVCLACSGQTTVDLLPVRTETVGGASGSTYGGIVSSIGGVSGSTLGGTVSNAGGSTPTASAGRSGLPAELIHRWDFSGTGVEVSDRVGGAFGTVVGGAALDGNGHLSITDGVSYVALPTRLLSSTGTSSITIAAWVTWFGGASWQRVFDFGSTTTNDGLPGQANAQFYFTPRFEPRQFFSVLLDNDSSSEGQAVVEGTVGFPVKAVTSIAVVLDGDEQAGTSTLRLYLDGARIGESSALDLRLSEFDDQNCWLGQSQWAQDSEPLTHWNGEFDEFRIYARALSEREVANLSLADPSAL